MLQKGPFNGNLRKGEHALLEEVKMKWQQQVTVVTVWHWAE